VAVTRVRRWLLRALLGGVAAVVVVVGFLVFAYTSVSLPAEPPRLQTTVIVDAEGGQLAELYKQNRSDVTLDQVAPILQQAVVATEDRNFFEHSGIDPVGITRALVNDLRGESLQGGSTITQQLVKNTYLTAERTIIRKAREAILAVKVERELSKEEILERYLNTIYFGRGAYGIEKAARAYFGAPASELTLPQAALLAGLIRAPERADPATAPDEAVRRRGIALDALVRAGRITTKEAAAARTSPLGAVPRSNPNAGTEGSAAYFTALVSRWAIGEFGPALAFGGGLRIETTLDPAKQAAAEDAIRSVLDRPEDPDAALVSMADDGAVEAMIGGKDFAESAVNLAVRHDRIRPQAGSTFKPFVLAAALEADIPLDERYRGPATATIDFEGEAPYEVENYGGQSFGTLDLTEATVHSVNTAYTQLAADVGIEAVAEMAYALGIDSEVPEVPSIALGSANIAPIEMVRAYLTFANRGERVAPYFVRRVTDADGDELYEAHPRRDRELSEEHADVVNHVLRQVIERGTGRAADIGRPAAGKTGTTTDNTDAWFVGYTPDVGTAVWLGYRDSARPMERVHGRAVTGGSFPAQIWQRYMRAATRGTDVHDFVAPEPSLLGTTTTSTTPTTSTTSTSSTTSSTSTSLPADGSTTTSSSSTSTTSTSVPTTTTTTNRGRGRASP
jgi:membrane peptidoglycan carboxypeptidase